MTKRKRTACLRPRALVLALLVSLAACVAPPPSLTLTPADSSLARRVADLARSAGGRFGIAALHIESGRRLEWNAAESFEAASVIKLALLVEAAARIADGTLDPGARWTLTERRKAAPSSLLDDFDPGLAPTERDLLMLMIARSDNTAANRFIDLFGAETVNKRMERLGFPEIRLLGRIPDRDPEATQGARWKGLRLAAMTPRATAELYSRIATRTLPLRPAPARPHPAPRGRGDGLALGREDRHDARRAERLRRPDDEERALRPRHLRRRHPRHPARGDQGQRDDGRDREGDRGRLVSGRSHCPGRRQAVAQLSRRLPLAVRYLRATLLRYFIAQSNGSVRVLLG